MNDKEFKEVLETLFGLDEETLQATLAEDEPTENENREFAIKIADSALECAGFKNTLIVAEDDEGFGMTMVENHIVAAHLIIAVLEHAPQATLEHVLSHFGKVGGER